LLQRQLPDPTDSFPAPASTHPFWPWHVAWANLPPRASCAYSSTRTSSRHAMRPPCTCTGSPIDDFPAAKHPTPVVRYALDHLSLPYLLELLLPCNVMPVKGTRQDHVANVQCAHPIFFSSILSSLHPDNLPILASNTCPLFPSNDTWAGNIFLGNKLRKSFSFNLTSALC
jgi:hypothetical protein